MLQEAALGKAKKKKKGISRKKIGESPVGMATQG